MARDGSPTKPAKRQPIRQRSPLTIAWVIGATGLVTLTSLALNWADNPEPAFAAWVVLGLAVAWWLFVRPAVILDNNGVTIRNLFKDIHIPWRLVTDVESRWNLKVYVGDKGYTVWAISSQVARPPSAVGGLAGSLMPSRTDKQANANTPSHDQKITAPAVARAIEDAKEQYDEAVAHGALPAVPDAVVQVRWVPLVFAVLLLPAVAAVVLSRS